MTFRWLKMRGLHGKETHGDVTRGKWSRHECSEGKTEVSRIDLRKRRWIWGNVGGPENAELRRKTL